MQMKSSCVPSIRDANCRANQSEECAVKSERKECRQSGWNEV